MIDPLKHADGPNSAVGSATPTLNNLVPEAAREDGAELGAAHGWAALRADVERRLAEARRELAQYEGKRVPKIEAFYDGEIAALKWLLKRDDARKEARPIEALTAGEEGRPNS